MCMWGSEDEQVIDRAGSRSSFHSLPLVFLLSLRVNLCGEFARRTLSVSWLYVKSIGIRFDFSHHFVSGITYPLRRMRSTLQEDWEFFILLANCMTA